MIQELTTHLWQSTFFAVAVGMLTLAFRKNRAQVRYWLWLSASLKFFAPFALLISLGTSLESWVPDAHHISVVPVIAYTIEQFSQPVVPETLPPLPQARDTIHWIPGAMLVMWLSGFLTIVRTRFRGWLRVREAVRGARASALPPGFGPANVEIRRSSGQLEPGVIGLLRPILLLPDGITERLTPSELKAVIAHELCHIRRRDNLGAAVHMIVEAVFWFHPLVWWIGARLVEERERACDEEVLSLGNQPDVYADAILSVCKLYMESPLACVSGVSGASIRRRIETIMSNHRLQDLTGARKLLFASAGIAALAGPVVIGLVIGIGNVPMIRAQSPVTAPPIAQTAPGAIVPTVRQSPSPSPSPRFDVASIKRCMPGDELNGIGGRGGGGGRGPRLSPGRLTVQCLDVAMMINMVYARTATDRPVNFSTTDPPEKQFRGGPAWVYSDWYTIEAKTDDPVANGPTSPNRTAAGALMMGPMLQEILEDRFRLKLHRETEDVPMYALTVAKSGIKIQPLPGGCIQLDPTQEHHASDFEGPKPVCNTIIGGMNGPNRTWQINGHLSMIAGSLSGVLQRTVLDKTGIDGVFSIHLEYAPDDNTPPRRRPDGSLPPEPEPSDIPRGDPIFTAVEQQLGLKLVPDKGPQGFFVIDHVERPSEN